jgi:iron complex outermembrane receptor protein
MQTFYTRKFLGMDKSNGFSIYQDDGATYYDVGDPNPKTLLGITSAFRFKKFTLTANMYGALGQDVYNATEMFILNVSNIQHGGNISLLTFKNPVKESFDNPLLPSSRYIKSGSYFKMANLTFSYNAGEVLKTFKAMNIFITGQNLFLITRYDGFDPETNSLTGVNGSNNTNVPSLGIDYPHYPSARTFIIGLSFSL